MKTSFVAIFATAFTMASAVTISLPSGVSIPSGISLPSGVTVVSAQATATAAAGSSDSKRDLEDYEADELDAEFDKRQNVGGQSFSLNLRQNFGQQTKTAAAKDAKATGSGKKRSNFAA